jgi:hypothetical protein
MRACVRQILMPGLISEIQEKSELFPFPGKPLMVVPMDKVAVPFKETGNPRCK